MLEMWQPLNNPLVSKLRNIAPLSDDDCRVLADLKIQKVQLDSGQNIVREGDKPSRVCLILSGVAAWQRISVHGKRHILGLHVAGDIPDLQSLHLAVVDTTLTTIGHCMVGFIDHDALNEMIDSHPAILVAFWRASLVEAAVGRAWLFASQNPGPKRLAHLFCEYSVRSVRAGLGVNRFAFPLTQLDLGNASGLSSVHVNRTLQEMRAADLIQLDRDNLEILNKPGLAALAEFDPGYLHFKRDPLASVPSSHKPA